MPMHVGLLCELCSEFGADTIVSSLTHNYRDLHPKQFGGIRLFHAMCWSAMTKHEQTMIMSTAAFETWYAKTHEMECAE